MNSQPQRQPVTYSAKLTAVCALCGHEIPRSYLRVHTAAERKQIEEYTISFIKSQHPEWTEQDATCQQCWDYYKHLLNHE